jgi:sodium/potassium-transporting ATPase subunit alpha
MIPAISFAYENAESDIMTRNPRDAKKDRLVNRKLVSWAYLKVGIVQALGGFYTYLYVMNDFGIAPHTVWFLSFRKGFFPDSDNVYDPDAVGFGNANYGVSDAVGELSWAYTTTGNIDIRLFYTNDADPTDTHTPFSPQSWSTCRWAPDQGYPDYYVYSDVVFINKTGKSQICYTTEALMYAQSAYLVSIVCQQWASLLTCKTRTLSISQQGMRNGMGNFGLVFETVLMAVLLYVPGINRVL